MQKRFLARFCRIETQMTKERSSRSIAELLGRKPGAFLFQWREFIGNFAEYLQRGGSLRMYPLPRLMSEEQDVERSLNWLVGE